MLRYALDMVTTHHIQTACAFMLGAFLGAALPISQPAPVSSPTAEAASPATPTAPPVEVASAHTDGDTLSPPLVRVLAPEPAEERLRAEVDTLRRRIVELEAARPTTQGEWAVHLRKPESEVAGRLRLSKLFADAARLRDTIALVGPQVAWDALLAEDQMRSDIAQFRTQYEPPLSATHDERIAFIRGPLANYVLPRVQQTCDSFYRLGLPSQVVESFRNDMTRAFR